MGQPSQMRWWETLEKYFPIHLEGEPLPADTNPQDKITTTTPTSLMGMQDLLGHTQALDRLPPGHKEAEVIPRLGIITIVKEARAPQTQITTTIITDRGPRTTKDTLHIIPLATPRLTTSFNPPTKDLQRPHNHTCPPPRQANPVMTVEGPGLGPGADPCREATKETLDDPQATPPARREDQRATEVAATASTG